MGSIALERGDVVVGVDTHKDQHVAVALDGLGGRLTEPLIVDATNDGYAELLAWACGLGSVHTFAVEGCGSYGIGLARFLRRHGHPPVEVARPPRAGERRASGKSDAIDAEHAARLALSGTGLVIPKVADGQIEAIRLVKIARDTAVKAHTTAIITLKAVLVTAEQSLRDDLESLSDFKLLTACAALDVAGDLADPDVAMRHTLVALAARWFDLHEEIKIHSKHLKALTRAAAPQLLEAFGVGLDIAAQMLITAATTTIGSAMRPPSPSCAGSVLSPPDPARPAVGIASIRAATARPTRLSIGRSSSACVGMLRRSGTLPAPPARQQPTGNTGASRSRIDRLDDL
jgi:transposase